MVGALAQEGTVVGVLADNLLRAATSARFRPSLMNGNLLNDRRQFAKKVARVVGLGT
jgi:hypothetical protein